MLFNRTSHLQTVNAHVRAKSGANSAPFTGVEFSEYTPLCLTPRSQRKIRRQAGMGRLWQSAILPTS